MILNALYNATIFSCQCLLNKVCFFIRTIIATCIPYTAFDFCVTGLHFSSFSKLRQVPKCNLWDFLDQTFLENDALSIAQTAVSKL